MKNTITEKQYLSAIVALVEENPDMEIKVGDTTITAEGLGAFAQKKIDQLAAKAANKKPKEESEADLRYISIIKDALAEVEKATIAQIKDADNSLLGLSTPKMTALLKKAGAVKSTEGKTVFFALVTE